MVFVALRLPSTCDIVRWNHGDKRKRQLFNNQSVFKMCSGMDTNFTYSRTMFVIRRLSELRKMRWAYFLSSFC